MAQKPAIEIRAGDIVEIDGVAITVERIEANVAIVWFGPRFPGFPDAENSYGCGGTEMITVIEPE